MKTATKSIISSKKIYTALTAVLLMLLTLRFAYSDQQAVDRVDYAALVGGHFDPSINDWYAVEPWELEVCREWGGTELASNNAQVSSTLYLSQTTAALQASFRDLPDGTRIFKISHYVQPFQQDLRFAVKLTNEPSTGDPRYRTVVTPTDVTVGNSNAGFKTFVVNEFWNYTQMAIGDTGNVNTIITVPVRNETAIFNGCTAACGTIPAADPWTGWS